MGYIRHHAILVTSSNHDLLRKAYKKAHEIFDRPIGNIVDSLVNGYRSFLIPPDGSKEGWQTSNKNNYNRQEYTRWLDKQRYEDKSTSLKWIEVEYGDERGLAEIVKGSEEPLWGDE